MPLPVILGAAKSALVAAKALKAAKVAKAAKAMGSAGKMKALSSKGASAIKGPSVKKELITKGSNNVGSKENLKAAKNRLKQTKKTDRLLRRDERRTNFKNKVGEMKKNMDKRASEATSAPKGNEKTKKKESSQDIYNKTKSSLERKDRRSAAMDNFATKGTMKHGGKYMDGGRKKPLKKLKGAIQKANYKAGAVKNRLEKKVLESIKRKKAMKKMPGGGKMDLYKKGGKKFPDLNKDGKITMADILQGRGVKKAGKGMKYKKGGKH